MLLHLIERIRSDSSGFTIIELVFASVILAIIAAPVSAIMIAASAESVKAREHTSASQLLQSQLEAIRTLPYTQVGTVNGNPSGVLLATQPSTLSNGTAVTIATSVSYVNDSADAYTTNADYKKVVITVTRTSDGAVLASTSTNLSAASAPPNSGSEWVQIQRTVVDAVNTGVLAGATVTVTGGPSSITRADTTDGSGSVLFPALDDSTSGSPVYSLAASLTGYAVYPDDLAPQAASQVSSATSTTSSKSLRMYQPVSLTVNLQTSAGAAYTGGATLSLESTRCGVATVSVPSGSSQATFTTCQWANGRTVSLVPNVGGQVPAFDKYTVTMWNAAGTSWGVSPAFSVPSNYPTTLTQTATVAFSSTTYSTKTVNVTVRKSGVIDTNARVYLTGGPAGVALYGVTNGTGVATFTIPVTGTSTSFTAGANDQGVQQGSTSFSASSGSSSPIGVTVNIS